MTSSGPDRSIASISLPQWMKSKISDRYDLEQTAFSPPNTDDGFFLVKYKKAMPEQTEPPKVTTTKQQTKSPLIQAFEEKLSSDSNQQSTFCQKFISNSTITPREIGMRHGVDSPLTRFKTSTGTEDASKGESTTCGYSVVAVAHQMIAERAIGDKLEAPPVSQRIRRNSKSLPASPQTSPKLLRKNPYFTNIIFGSTEAVDSNEGQSSSLMRGSVEELGNWSRVNRKFNEVRTESSLAATSTVTTHIQQQTQLQQNTTLTQQLFTPSPPAPATSTNSGFGQVVTLKAKPSHLREMNFWSPTSM
ncbi:uncharacterized protein [Rhodnius prolixus]|uniref:Uncharacterized protein n=1 Tax=Rhodnius prolixus TaxID=13249 RepID=R4FNH2_RHOPR